MFELEFEKLPDQPQGNIKPGTHVFTIVEAKIITANTGSIMLQLSHQIDNTNFKINYDNYVICDAQGDPIEYGQVKLKHLLEAINIKPQGKFTLSILPPLLKNKKFIADLDYAKDKNGVQSKYLSIVDINSYKPYQEPVQQQIANELDTEI